MAPGERMKTGKEHYVPLSPRAVEMLAKLPRVSDTYLFVGRGDHPPHQHTLVRLMRTMGRPEVAHGFRASFKTWAEEMTQYPPHVIEMALAHQVGSAVER